MPEYDAQPIRTPPAQPEQPWAQLHADELDLRAGLQGVAFMVAGMRTMSEILGNLAEFARRAIPGAEGTGVTSVRIMSGRPHVQTWAVTTAFVEQIHTVQYNDLEEGPCLTCMASRQPAVSGSLGSDRRWPHLGGRVARMGVHSVLSLPLIVGEQVIGAIDSYAHERDAFTDHAVELGSQFAASAAVSLYNAQLLADTREHTERLQRALASRVMVDQAIGIIRSRSGVTVEDAFDRLTRLSQNQNVKLHVVAEQMVDEAVRKARIRRA
jgi:GAF domain-containing protein